MSEELKAIDWLRAKTISYESRSEELYYALILYNLIMNLQKENEELKKQLSNGHQIKNQQKEFIEWLEDYIDALIQQKETVAELDVTEVHILMTLEEVLSKYKEIVGGLDDKN